MPKNLPFEVTLEPSSLAARVGGTPSSSGNAGARDAMCDCASEPVRQMTGRRSGTGAIEAIRAGANERNGYERRCEGEVTIRGDGPRIAIGTGCGGRDLLRRNTAPS
jgi:hypothetical protein